MRWGSALEKSATMWLHRSAAHLLLLLPVLAMPLLARGQSSRGVEAVAGPSCTTTPLPVQVGPNAFISKPKQLVDVGGTLFFMVEEAGVGQFLWRSDGTEAGTVQVKGPSLQSWEATATLAHFTAVGQRLFFSATTAVGQTGLWVSDGTEAGTRRVQLFPSTGLNTQSEFLGVGNTLFFTADDGSVGWELWKSDGTNTVLVQDIQSGGGSFPSGLTELNGQVFFAADDGIHGTELWKSDGTQAVMVKDIRSSPDSALPSMPNSLRAMGGVLYFTALDDTTPNATLWQSDGTGAGTQRVAPQSLSVAEDTPQELTVAGSRLFFRLRDAEHNEEVWVSDGTEAGTHLTTDIQKGNFSSIPQQLTAVGERLFLLANDNAHGLEPWRSDGTPEGTRLVRDFSTNTVVPPNTKLAVGPGVLLVRVNDGVTGSQLWKVDEVGVTRLTNIVTEASCSEPDLMTMSGGKLFFVACAPSQGNVLYVLPLNQVDCSAPVLSCPGDQEVEAANPNGAWFSVPPFSVVDDAVAMPELVVRPQLEGFFRKGDTSVTIDAKDKAGNPASCTIHVKVQDRTAPLLLCPEKVEQEATGPSGAQVTYFVVASDAATSHLKVEYSHAPGEVFPVAMTPVRVSADDGVNPPTVCTFPVTVRDTVRPTLTCPEDKVLTAENTALGPVDYTYEASDVVTPKSEMSLITSHPPGSLFPVGETQVTLTVRDRAGNASDTCSFRVERLDLEPPTITCPGPQRVASTSSEGAVVRFPVAEANDNLDGTQVSYSQEPGSFFPMGETTVTATVTDAGQHTASCSFTVTVVEQINSDGGCQAGASGGMLGWLLVALAPLVARRRAARGTR